ncbi:hypothetical protein ABW19_dt0208871 [Dactylella cylindrospora]|nr:hypothetical protein ABW19_dt0208871 [Dactylella cylindrospora]
MRYHANLLPACVVFAHFAGIVLTLPVDPQDNLCVEGTDINPQDIDPSLDIPEDAITGVSQDGSTPQNSDGIQKRSLQKRSFWKIFKFGECSTPQNQPLAGTGTQSTIQSQRQGVRPDVAGGVRLPVGTGNQGIQQGQAGSQIGQQNIPIQNQNQGGQQGGPGGQIGDQNVPIQVQNQINQQEQISPVQPQNQGGQQEGTGNQGGGQGQQQDSSNQSDDSTRDRLMTSVALRDSTFYPRGAARNFFLDEGTERRLSGSGELSLAESQNGSGSGSDQKGED